MSMKFKIKIPEKGKLFSSTQLRSLILPLIVEQILAVTVGLADTVMVSNVGEASLSGVSLVDMLNVVIIYVFAALATGGAVVASQYMGAKNQEQACHSASQLLFTTGLVSLFLTVLILLLKKPILLLCYGDIDADVLDYALTYLRITALSYPFYALYSGTNALFRSMEKAHISMKTSLLMNVLNVAGNALLIYGFRMGVAGAAYATLFSRVVACILSLWLLTDQKAPISISFRHFPRPNLKMIGLILKIGIPNGLENSAFRLGRVLVLGIVSVFGTVEIAANAVANSLTGIFCIPGSAIGLAMITVVGQCIGAGEPEQAIYYARKLLKITYMLMISIAIVELPLLPWILKVYHLSEKTARLATILISIHLGFGMFLWPLSFTLPNALRAANDATFTMIVSISSMVVFRIGFSYVLALGLELGSIGVWLSMVIDWIFRITCFVWRSKSGRWLQNSSLIT